MYLQWKNFSHKKNIMDNYFKMINALDKIPTVTHEEKLVKNRALNVLFNHLHENKIKIDYHPKKGFFNPK